MPLIGKLAPENNLITINTNGRLLTSELAKELYKKGVDVLQFSMDSFFEKEHDKFRGMEGTYSKLLDSIRNKMLDIPRLSSYSSTCHVAEDREFIKKVLSKTFSVRKIFDYRDCFKDDK